jgi:hypothetical protein
MSLRNTITIVATTLALAAVAVPVRAGSVTNNGITMSWPDYAWTGPGAGSPLLSCDPVNSAAGSVTLTGVPAGANVLVSFAWFDPYATNPATIQPAVSYPNVAGGTLTVAVPYPPTDAWPYYDATSNERAIGIGVSASVSTNGTLTILAANTAKWWARCLPPPPPPPDEGGAGGCTPGYWKQDQHFDSWETYRTTDEFALVFGVVPTKFAAGSTLLEALWLGGGGERALARHAVAALLNAARADYTFPYTESEIVAGVQSAFASGDYETFKDALDRANNTGCPLN